MSSISNPSLHESRVFEPPRRVGSPMPPSPAWTDLPTRCAPKPPATTKASGRASRAKRSPGTSRSRKVLDESNAPFYKWFEDGELNASYNCLDRHLEQGNGDKRRDHLRSRRRQRHPRHLPRPAPARLPFRQRRSSRSASRRAIASSSTCRCRSRASSRCRPARASVPRIRSCSAASRRSRCRSGSSTSARSPSSPPTSRCAAARRCR